MVEYIITAVKFRERRNGTKCASYWSVESERNDSYHIYDHWFCKVTPKRILKILETSPEDSSGYGEKRGEFLLTLDVPLVFRDFGHIKKFENVLSIMAMKAPIGIK
jgi:hypothetical protein